MMTERVLCNVKQITPITNSIYYVYLEPEHPINFKAGQYLDIVINEDDKRSFSIASAFNDKNFLELHIGSSENSHYIDQLMDYIKFSKMIEVEIPKGGAYFREESNRPLMLIAGGTGYSYTRSIFLAAINQDPLREIYFYWGGRKPHHIYDLPFLHSMKKNAPNLKIIAIVEKPDDIWSGEQGLLLDNILQENKSLADFDIYICGPFAMSYAARERFSQEANANVNHIYSDAFSFLK